MINNMEIQKKDWLKATINYLFSKNTNIKTHYNYFGRTKFKVITNMLSSIIKKHYRESFIDKNLEIKVNLNSSFMYYPLGVDLERNLLVNSPFQTNQIEIIRHIVKITACRFQTLCKRKSSTKDAGMEKYFRIF